MTDLINIIYTCMMRTCIMHICIILTCIMCTYTMRTIIIQASCVDDQPSIIKWQRQRIRQRWNILLTRFHWSPAEFPTGQFLTATIIIQVELNRIGAEHNVDDVGCACDVCWQDSAAAPLHQDCPVAVRDCQVVIFALNFKGSEMQLEYLSLLHLQCVRLLQVVWIFERVVWRGEVTCAKMFELEKMKL